MAIIPPSIGLSLAQLQANVNLVLQRVTVQNTNVTRIDRTVSNTYRTVNSIQNFDDPELRRLSEEILSTITRVRGMVQATRSEVIRRGQTISATLHQLLVDIEEATGGIEAEIRSSTTQLIARLNTLQAQVGSAIAESRALTEARIDLLQAEILAGVATLEGLLIASRELAETTKLILGAAIAGVASETSTILVIASNTEVSVLYNRGVLRSKASKTRSQLSSEVRDSRRKLLNDLTRLLTKGLENITKKVVAKSHQSSIR